MERRCATRIQRAARVALVTGLGTSILSRQSSTVASRRLERSSGSRHALAWDRCVRTDARFCLAWRKPFVKQCPLLGPSDAAKWWELRTLRDELVSQPAQGACTK